MGNGKTTARLCANINLSLIVFSNLSIADHPDFDLRSRSHFRLAITPLFHRSICPFFRLAGREGLDPPTDGFGDRYSTN